MRSAIGEFVGGLVELVSRTVHAVIGGLLRWPASKVRPGWVRVVAVALIVLACLMVVSFVLWLFKLAFYLLIVVAAVAAAIAYFGLG